MHALVSGDQPLPVIGLRPASAVMRLSKLGASHRTRLSFLRALLRRIEQQAWRYERSEWVVNELGVGHAVYTLHGPQRPYSLVAFAHDLPDDMRSDRVIATAWDATFTLFDGIPTAHDIVRLAANVPKQETGRVTDSELTLARANRSVRLWSHVVKALAKGEQPDVTEINNVGYLMRTTAVYGSGKFGAADRVQTAWRDEMAGPFRAEMLTVWLIRNFTIDYVEHMAQQAGGAQACKLHPEIRRLIGVGNSTGLGMAPFLVNHPALLHQWIECKEHALQRVRAVPAATEAACAVFVKELDDAVINASQWTTDHPLQIERVAMLRQDLELLRQHVDTHGLSGPYPWNDLFKWGETHMNNEGQEQLIGLMLEHYGDLVDDLADQMSIDETKSFTINGAMQVSQLQQLIADNYQWALDIDFSDNNARSRFWYVSEEKLEPRLGQRFTEEGASLELSLGTAELVQHIASDLASSAHTNVASFLYAFPQHRQVVRRIQLCAQFAYAEIQDNLLSADMLPIELLRCKLAFFGATKFDPRSDRWLRISLYQNAPTPQDICLCDPVTHSANAADSDQTTQQFSLSEIDSLSKRAARGAGLSWGLAEEAGKAVRWLQAHGQAGAQALLGVLNHNDGLDYHSLCPNSDAKDDSTTWQSRIGHMCPLIAGSTLVDYAGVGVTWPLRLEAVTHPSLLVPFVARAAQENDFDMQVTWAQVQVTCLANGDVIGMPLGAGDNTVCDVTIALPNNASDVLIDTHIKPWVYSHKAQAVADSTWDALQTFAHRTLVPSTEASRAGAGGTRSDND